MTGRPDARVALVTGANRGIGYEICRQLAERGLRVVLTARTSAQGREAAGRLARGRGDVRFERLDVADPATDGFFYQRNRIAW